MTSMTTMRMAIDEFCAERAIAIDSPLAINAAHHMLGIAGRDRSLSELRAELDEWCRRQDSDETRASARRRSSLS